MTLIPLIIIGVLRLHQEVVGHSAVVTIGRFSVYQLMPYRVSRPLLQNRCCLDSGRGCHHVAAHHDVGGGDGLAVLHARDEVGEG